MSPALIPLTIFVFGEMCKISFSLQRTGALRNLHLTLLTLQFTAFHAVQEQLEIKQILNEASWALESLEASRSHTQTVVCFDLLRQSSYSPILQLINGCFLNMCFGSVLTKPFELTPPCTAAQPILTPRLWQQVDEGGSGTLSWDQFTQVVWALSRWWCFWHGLAELHQRRQLKTIPSLEASRSDFSGSGLRQKFQRKKWAPVPTCSIRSISNISMCGFP